MTATADGDAMAGTVTRAATTPAEAFPRRAIALWLAAVAAMVLVTLVVGGATRLTDSGLSITEWRPVTGVLPPLTEAAWQAEMDKYRQIPEYQLVNRGMSLDAFKTIYWWEWGHRMAGRAIGLVFAVPFVLFWIRGALPGWLKPRLLVLFALGGLQGAVGWWMVASGLTDRVDVSQYRLAVHLTLACVILALTVWTMAAVLDRGQRGAPRPGTGVRWASGALLALLLFQIFLGGLVAGLDAGLASNTWPLMNGAVVPAGLFTLSPWWLNLFENPLTVQFDHRIAGYVLWAVALAHLVQVIGARAGRAAMGRAAAIFLVMTVQATTGVLTVLLGVPMDVALLHQFTGGLLVALAAWHARAMLVAGRPAEGAVPAEARRAVAA